MKRLYKLFLIFNIFPLIACSSKNNVNYNLFNDAFIINNINKHHYVADTNINTLSISLSINNIKEIKNVFHSFLSFVDQDNHFGLFNLKDKTWLLPLDYYDDFSYFELQNNYLIAYSQLDPLGIKKYHYILSDKTELYVSEEPLETLNHIGQYNKGKKDDVINLYVLNFNQENKYFALDKNGQLFDNEEIDDNHDLYLYGVKELEGYQYLNLSNYGKSDYYLYQKNTAFLSYDHKGRLIANFDIGTVDHYYFALNYLFTQKKILLNDDAKKYDYIYDDQKYDVISRIYNILDGSYKEINTDYIINQINTNMYDQNGYIHYVSAEVKTIKNKQLEDNKTYILDENGKRRNDITDIDFTSLITLNNHRYYDQNKHIIYNDKLEALSVYDDINDLSITQNETYLIRKNNSLYGVYDTDKNNIISNQYPYYIKEQSCLNYFAFQNENKETIYLRINSDHTYNVVNPHFNNYTNVEHLGYLYYLATFNNSRYIISLKDVENPIILEDLSTLTNFTNFNIATSDNDHNYRFVFGVYLEESILTIKGYEIICDIL